MARLISAMTPGELLSECFVPSFAVSSKVRGTWHRATKVLFPGYVIAVSADAPKLRRSLAKVPEFTRLLGAGDHPFMPLTSRDRSLIEELTSVGRRTVAISRGYAVGDRVVVTQGPLMGHEAWITGFNRRKSLAYLKVQNFFGRDTVTGKAGLEILERKEEHTTP